MRVLLIALTLYFAFYEFVCMVRDGWSYIFDIFNYIDLVSFSLNVYLVYATVVNDYNVKDRSTIRGFAMTAVVLMWFKAFYWLRLFKSTSFYVRLIRETLWDVRYFMILFLFILMTFGNALMILNEKREPQLFQNFFNLKFPSAVLNQYILSLGEFDTENFESNGEDILVWLIFIGTTFITNVTFLNMLIAIMGDTFDRVSEVKDQSALKEKIQILADYVIVVRRESIEKGNLSRFIFAITPKALGADELGSWEGTVTQLKRTIESNQ